MGALIQKLRFGNQNALNEKIEISFLHMNHQKIDNIPSVLFMYLKVVQKLVDVYPVTKTV